MKRHGSAGLKGVYENGIVAFFRLIQKDPRILGHGEVFDGYKYYGNPSHSWDAVMGKTNQPATTDGKSGFKVVTPTRKE